MLLDLHSHRQAPYPEGIINIMDCNLPRQEGQLYSVGLHPWDTADGDVPEEVFEGLERLVDLPEVVAIGECGVDTLKGGPMFRQLLVFKRQVELSERVGKPLIVHAVKAMDMILGLKRDLNPAQPWIIHGFRGKPALATQLLEKGLYLSFGEHFNPETVRMVPEDRIFAETDESPLPIAEIIASLSEARGADLTPVIAANLQRLIQKEA